MGSDKALLLLALLVALVLVVASSRDLAETSAEKESGLTTESSNIGGVDDAKYGGYHGGNGGYGGNGGGYQGGYGGRGGGGGGRGGRGGGCYYGCCRRYNYGRGCRSCCSYAGEAVDSEEP